MPSSRLNLHATLPRRRVRWVHFWLYARAVLGEFRWSLLGLAMLIALGGALYAVTPLAASGRRLSWAASLYAAWMAMLAQPIESPPNGWYLMVLCAAYPVVGFTLIGEGVVRLSLLMVSRRNGEEEWMKVIASTLRDHVVLCGLGHLGFRVLEQLVASNVDVAAIERDPNGRFVAQAKAFGIPVFLGDMKQDQLLVDAGIARARTVIIATNDDMANLEVAIDSRRMNPDIRVAMRLYDQQIAAKLSNTLLVDAAYSASALAAPYVAALSLATRVTPSAIIGGVPYVTSEVTIRSGSAWRGLRLTDIEQKHAIRVLARTTQGGELASPPPIGATAEAGDVLVVHCKAAELLTLLDGQEAPRSARAPA